MQEREDKIAQIAALHQKLNREADEMNTRSWLSAAEYDRLKRVKMMRLIVKRELERLRTTALKEHDHVSR